jgi:hypothetical protein
MAGDNPPKNAPPTEQQQEMANGTANMLAHAAAATQASEAESRGSFEGTPAKGDYSARLERPTRL